MRTQNLIDTRNAVELNLNLRTRELDRGRTNKPQQLLSTPTEVYPDIQNDLFEEFWDLIEIESERK